MTDGHTDGRKGWREGSGAVYVSRGHEWGL